MSFGGKIDCAPDLRAIGHFPGEDAVVFAAGCREPQPGSLRSPEQKIPPFESRHFPQR